MKYVISSARFATKKQAIKQLEEWNEEERLDENARVYKVSKSFKPISKIELKEEK